MKKWRRNLLSLSSLAKNLGFASVYSATKFDYHIEIKEEIKANRVLVLAPHPDDDVFGCGGTCKKIADGGGSITVCYFCDGAGGVPEGRDEAGEVRHYDQNLINIRKSESKKSAEILGIGKQVFFGYRDGKLAAGSAAIRALSDLIKEIKPDIIFVPSFLDNHPDHRVVNEILINVLSQEKFDGEIWAYEIWTPIFPNRVINITSNIESKKQAMNAQVSQLKSRGYDKAIIGLNQYRAEINNFSGYGEAYFVSKFDIYRKLYRKS